MGTILFIITFISNSVGDVVIRRMRRRMQGAV
jgi:hypothetical protein